MVKRLLDDDPVPSAGQQSDRHREKRSKNRKLKLDIRAVNEKTVERAATPSSHDTFLDHNADFVPLIDVENDWISAKTPKKGEKVKTKALERARVKALRRAEAIGAVPNDRFQNHEEEGSSVSPSANVFVKRVDVLENAQNGDKEKESTKKLKKDKQGKKEKEGESKDSKKKRNDLESGLNGKGDNQEASQKKGSPKDFMGYVESPTLSAMPQSEIDSFLSSNFISIADPKSTKPLRPIISFSQLPPPPRGGAYPFGSFKNPTPIQSASWPFLLSGRDVIGVAETGSGKTLAYGLPCIRYVCSLSPLLKNSKSANSIIMSPTRELAQQIYSQMILLATPATLKVVCVYGGVPKDPQREALKTAHIVVATPGRLKDLIDEGAVNLGEAGYLVLDEADRMLDKGFEEDIRKIISYTPSLANGRQTLMFTATWPPSVRELASTFMQSPVKIAIGDNNPSGDLRANTRIIQKIEVVDSHPRTKEIRLLQLLKQYQSGKARNDRILIFCLYKKEAARVEQFLRDKGMRVVGIHGDLSQDKRTGALEAFKKEGGVPLMVATDVAARGLDIPAVKVVINVTFPLTVEDYVHRIGR